MAAHEQEDKPWLPSDSPEEGQHQDEPWLPSESDEEGQQLDKDEPWLPDESEEEADHKATGGNQPLDLPSTSEAVQTKYIPKTNAGFPITFHSTAYFNWVIDRYKSWVKQEDLPKGKDKTKQICEIFNVSDQREIFRNVWDRQWGAGTVSFNRAYKAIKFADEDFTTYPWGLPAQKLYEAAEKRKQFNENTLYDKPFRTVLRCIEEWYFGQTTTAYDELKGLKITEWNLNPAILRDLNDLLEKLD